MDQFIDDFYSVLWPVIDRHAPEKCFKVRRDTPPLYLSRETSEAMKMRDRARQGQGGDYKMLRNKCVKLVRRDRMQTAMKRLSEASNQQAAAWRLADSTLKRDNSERLPLLKNCKSDVECATRCNDFFVEKVGKLVNGVKTSSETGETMTEAREFIKNLANGTPSFELNSVGMATTKKAIRSMGTTKAIGVDGLPCSFWKEYCEDLAPFVTTMINMSIRTGTYPSLFKDAIVVPVFKGDRKDREDPASYRPISVLPALSKVLEKVVIDQFLGYLDDNNLLPPHQHGFRRAHSTVTALVKTIQKWTSQKGAAIASFDYSAAFDTINKETLQQRLEDIGAHDNFKAWMASYMSGGRQKVRWNGALSIFVDRLHGVAQGSKAGPLPLLFIFVTMVNFALLKSAVGYADDTSNSRSRVQDLNSDSSALVNLSKELGLVLNPSKTQCVVYGKVQDSSDPVLVDGVTIAPSEKISILGFTLDNKASAPSLPERAGG